MLDLMPASRDAHVDVVSMGPMFFLLYHRPVLIFHKHIKHEKMFIFVFRFDTICYEYF